jgi:heme A synthase
VLAFNIGVVLWGAYVRATGAGAGCGNHWPLCNGEVVPRPRSIEMLIEFTHRATSGLALIAIAGLVFWAYRAYPRRHVVRTGAALSGLFIITEALVGAALVLFQHVAHDQSAARALWISLHLANTFTLLAVLALTAWWGTTSEAPLRRPGWIAISALAALVLVGISGAIAALGDTLFPATSLSGGLRQDFSQSAHIFVRLRVFHPGIAIAAAALLIFGVVREMRARRCETTQMFGIAVISLVFAQLILGAVNVTMLAPVPMQMVHLLVADLVWVSAVLFTAHSASVT